MICRKCKEPIQEDENFCGNCGEPVFGEAGSQRGALPPKASGLITFMEKRVYFKIARGFSWFILFVSTIALVYFVVSLVNIAPAYLGKSIKITKEAVLAAVERDENRRESVFSVQQHSDETVGDTEQAKRLDSDLYDFISEFFPQHIRKEGNLDNLRSQIKNLLSAWSGMSDRIDVVREMRATLKGMPPNEDRIYKAITKYIAMRKDEENREAIRKANATSKVMFLGSGILSAIVVITLVSLVLVLMAIERNTRKPDE